MKYVHIAPKKHPNCISVNAKFYTAEFVHRGNHRFTPHAMQCPWLLKVDFDLNELQTGF